MAKLGDFAPKLKMSGGGDRPGPESAEQEARKHEPRVASISWSARPSGYPHSRAPWSLEGWVLSSLSSKIFYQIFWTLLLKPLMLHILYHYLATFSQFHSSVIIYLEVRSKWALYECPTFEIQPVVPLCSNLRDKGHSSHISRSAPLPNPQLGAPADKDGADKKTAQIRCQGRDTYLETIFKILAKKTELGAWQVSHGTLWLSLLTAVGSQRDSKPELPAQAGRCLASACVSRHSGPSICCALQKAPEMAVISRDKPHSAQKW